MGSRGDLQPYLALGQALRQAGHRVKIGTAQRFAPLVAEAGFDFAPLSNALLDLMHSPTGHGALEDSATLWDWWRTTRKLSRQLRPAQRQMLDEAWKGAEGAEALVYHPKALGGLHIAQKLNIPAFFSAPMPAFAPTRAFPSPLFPPLKWGPSYNYFTYVLLRYLTRWMLAQVINPWRVETLGLRPQRWSGSEWTRADGQPLPSLYAYSPHLLPPPDDWPREAIVTGYWHPRGSGDYQPSDELVRFLAAGPPPVYFGFGSMVVRDPQAATRMILQVVQRLKIRAVIATGWGALEPVDEAPDAVHFVESVPHDWLLSKVRAVVHHGGAGTTAAGLLAGCPTLICPFFGDQPFWGRRVAALRLGPEPIPFAQLNAFRLENALDMMLNSRLFRERATVLARALQAEDGTRAAVSFIHEQIHRWRAEQSLQA